MRLYPLLPIAIMIIAGIVMGDAAGQKVMTLQWGIAFAAVTVIVLLTMRWKRMQSLLILLSALLLGATVIGISNDKGRVVFPKSEMMYEGVLMSSPVEHGKVVRFDMLMTKGEATGSLVKVALLRDTIQNLYKRLAVGDGIVAESEVTSPVNYPGATFDYATWLRRHGYRGQTFIYYRNWKKTAADLSGISRLQRTRLSFLRLRDRLVRTLIQDSVGQDVAVMAAMTLGDKSLLNADTKDDFSITGASHVLALSGLHLGIIFSLLTFIMPRRKWKMLTQLTIIMSIWAYALLVGLSPSVVRSAVMLTVYGMVSLLGRNKVSLNTLAFTAIIMLIVNPQNIFDTGFQMSFSAVAAILILYKPVYNLINEKWLFCHKLIRWLWQMFCVSLAAQMGTMPLIAYYFGRVSCYGMFANFIVIPLATIVLYATLLILLSSPVKSLAALLTALTGFLVSCMNAFLSWMASLPGVCIDGLSPSKLQVVLSYIVIGAVMIALVRLTRLLKTS